jgi:hypothetical protein
MTKSTEIIGDMMLRTILLVMLNEVKHPQKKTKDSSVSQSPTSE